MPDVNVSRQRLPFERAYLLESEPCSRCSGSGIFAAANSRMTSDCWNCRGTGRRLTREARELFNEICELLGHPVTERESRIAPRHLEFLPADLLRPGMRVQSTGWSRADPAKLIAKVDRLPLEQLRVTFWDGHRMTASAYLLFHRELTDEELDRVDALMAERVGRGAVAAG